MPNPGTAYRTIYPKRGGHSRNRRLPILLFGLLLCAVLLAVPATAATITVATDGTGDYITVYDALEAATEGDTILIRNGTYTETMALIITKNNIALMGENVDMVTLFTPVGVGVTISGS